MNRSYNSIRRSRTDSYGHRPRNGLICPKLAGPSGDELHVSVSLLISTGRVGSRTERSGG